MIQRLLKDDLDIIEYFLNFCPLNDFCGASYVELHIILTLKNLEIGEHGSIAYICVKMLENVILSNM